ncbi:MAG: CDP-glucose 4,6-dehydratase [Coriobacteriia bacterium]|nr:CDP-glucose 4,6-dehydratase [Coriobacteriia bacterium]
MEGVVGVEASLFAGVFSGRRVLITGHTGFKGSWLTEWLLGLGADVTGYALEPPTNPSLFDELGLAGRINHVIGDVRDLPHLARVLESTRPEFVFHLAAQPLVRLSYEEPVATYETNVMGTVNVLEAIRGCESVRVAIVVTSDKCYENRETGQAYREDDAMGGFDPYSSSKGCAELVVAAYRQSFFGPNSDVRLATVRAGNVIGGGDWACDRIVPDCVLALQAGEPIVVRNPDAVRPWQHVLEPLSGYLHLASLMWFGDCAYDGAWNFGPEERGTVPVWRVVDAMIASWGSGSWLSPEPKGSQPHEAKLLALDIGKAQKLLGWHPLYAIERTFWVTSSWYAARHTGASVSTLTDADIASYIDEAVRSGAAWARSDSDISESELAQ